MRATGLRAKLRCPRSVLPSRAGCGVRHAGTISNLPRLPVVAAFVLTTLGGIGIAMGLYGYAQIPPSPYPEEVTKYIRRALYYEGAGNDPKQAIQQYLLALEEATKQDLDQTSDDMTGLKIKIGTVYENSDRLDSAIRVYTGLLKELQAALKQPRISSETKTRLLRRAIGTSVKLGDLCLSVPASRHKAESAYVWALESYLREVADRQGDSTWLEEEAIGGLYEAVANFYYADHRPQLSLPLYLKALDTNQGANCHAITIMNNIASSISSQSNSLQVQENAMQWCIKARDLIVTCKDAEEKLECDIGRCSSLYNLGMISEKQSRLDDARGHYRDAVKMARSLRTSEGREIENMASQAITRIESR